MQIKKYYTVSKIQKQADKQIRDMGGLLRILLIKPGLKFFLLQSWKETLYNEPKPRLPIV